MCVCVCAVGDVSSVTYTAEALLFIMSMLTSQAMLLLAIVVMYSYLAATSIYRQTPNVNLCLCQTGLLALFGAYGA